MPSPERDSFTGAIASFVVESSFEDLTTEAVEQVVRAFVDTVGVTLAGATTPHGAAARAFVEASGGTGPATVYGGDVRTSLADAALANGVAGHSLDFDDTVVEMSLHPSVPIVVPLLALSETREVTGRELVAAYAAGFETLNAVNEPIMPSHYQHGWHSTGTIGTFGAAAAAAKLLGLTERETKNALGIAASMPGGIQRNFGTMTKAFHAGGAARSGLTAALLAENGLEAHEDAIDGSAGFFDVYGGDEAASIERPPLADGDRALEEYGFWIKKYPSCGGNHTAAAAAATLAEETGVAPADVEDVHVLVSEQTSDIHPYPDPETPDEARYSLEYTVARALAHGEPGVGAFDERELDDEATQRIRERVTFEENPDVAYNSLRVEVTVTTADGSRFGRELDYPPGHPEDPLSEEEFYRKYRRCATRLLDPETADAVYSFLSDLPAQDDVGAFVRTSLGSDPGGA